MTKRAKARVARARRTSERRKPGPQGAIKRHKSAQAVADLQNRLDQREHELTEALAQQAATSEVLRVISRLPGDLESVFQAMLTNATRLCEAKFGALYRYQDG